MQRTGGAAMTFPITPPTELVAQWLKQFYGPATRLGTLAPGEASLHVAAAAAQWGADQELEAIFEMVRQQSLPEEDQYLDGLTVASIRATRRPSCPPSLKEQALEALNQMDEPLGVVTARRTSIIRRALEALPND